MEITSIKPPPDFDFLLNNRTPHAKSFTLAPNGIDHNDFLTADEFTASDIEMIAIQAATAYTSLKDLLPASPPSIMSPTNGRRDSWKEIQIKDPLVQHAAWAYLQPMAVEEECDGRSFVQKCKDKCCGVFGCFNDVVLAMVKTLFSRTEEEEEQQQKNGQEDKFD